jgi:hypothetical protein
MKKYLLLIILSGMAFIGCKPKCVKCTSWVKQNPDQTKIWIEVCGTKKERDEFVHNSLTNKLPYQEVVCE